MKRGMNSFPVLGSGVWPCTICGRECGPTKYLDKLINSNTHGFRREAESCMNKVILGVKVVKATGNPRCQKVSGKDGITTKTGCTLNDRFFLLGA